MLTNRLALGFNTVERPGPGQGQSQSQEDGTLTKSIPYVSKVKNDPAVPLCLSCLEKYRCGDFVILIENMPKEDFPNKFQRWGNWWNSAP